eukprot:10929918-Alexandrium_andersonii.AAC.1
MCIRDRCSLSSKPSPLNSSMRRLVWRAPQRSPAPDAHHRNAHKGQQAHDVEVGLGIDLLRVRDGLVADL